MPANLAQPILITPGQEFAPGSNGAQFAVTAIKADFSDAQLIYTATNDRDKVDEITVEASSVDAATTFVLAVGWGGKTAECWSYTTVAPLIGPVVCISSRRLRGGGPVYVACLSATATDGVASKLSVYFERTRYADVS